MTTDELIRRLREGPVAGRDTAADMRAAADVIERLTNPPAYVHAGPPGWQRPLGQAVMPVIPIKMK